MPKFDESKESNKVSIKYILILYINGLLSNPSIFWTNSFSVLHFLLLFTRNQFALFAIAESNRNIITHFWKANILFYFRLIY